MRVAFDARVRPRSSFARVLGLLRAAAQAVELPTEDWRGGPCRAGVLWAPHFAPSRELLAEGELRLVLTLHDVNPLLPGGRSWPLSHWRRFHFQRCVQRGLRVSWRIATDSEDSRRRIADRFAAAGSRLQVVPLYAEACFQPAPAERAAPGLAALELHPGYLLYVGALRRHKNWQRLVAAYARLPRSLQRRHPLVLAGRVRRAGAGTRRLLRRHDLDHDLRFLDEVPEELLADLYRGAALFAFPSLAEGFGLPPLEAMACGTPVVSSDRTALPEVLGDAALYFDPLDVPAIAAALERVLTDDPLAQELRERGRRRAAEFGPRRTGEAMLRLLES